MRFQGWSIYKKIHTCMPYITFFSFFFAEKGYLDILPTSCELLVYAEAL